MSADLINPTGVDGGGLQVDDPAIQGFLALLEIDIQTGRSAPSDQGCQFSWGDLDRRCVRVE
jgi:hypothetical protein